MTKVVFPCDQATWWQVKDGLHRLKQLCEQGDIDLQTVAVEHQAIINISTGIGDFGSLEYKHSSFYNLSQFFIKKATPHERSHFLQETLPGIIDLALNVERLLPTEGIAVSQQQNGETRLLERRLCCSVLACAFLCLIPETHGPKLGRCINFAKFFSFLYLSSQMAKLRCILNFFDRVSVDDDRLDGNIAFTRLVLKKDELPTIDTWLNSSATLCPVLVYKEGCIEDSSPEAIEVDFANKYIGGGTVGKGRVQEEIRFTVCPELIVSMLFMESMEENEAIIIKGYEQFAKTEGYANSLMFTGDYRDSCQRDADGFLKNTLCAIDAISYSCRKGAWLARQYQDFYVLRDLNKAFVGFSAPFIIPEEEEISGRNGVEEHYYTADEEESNKQEMVSLPRVPEEGSMSHEQMEAIDRFVDNLLREAMQLALPEAISCNGQDSSEDSTRQQMDNRSQRTSSLNDSASDEIHMSHLEVNYRDWYANYRRRSSNLSDLSSRRSSWDVASRRSSGCSMRGYSSEFSSEFEEYFDNFQIQDQRYKYHTIKEEVGTSSVHDFATTLATSLLKQCTVEVSQLESGIQKFDDARPGDVENPQSHHIVNPILVSNDEFLSSSPEDQLSDSCVRSYVDRLFETIWPFGNVDSWNKEVKDEMIVKILTSCAEPTGNNETSSNNVNAYRDCEEEEYLLSVADALVNQAIEEALVEYRYRYLCPVVRTIEAQVSTESNQSDHSLGNKDQSNSMKQAQPSSASQLEASSQSSYSSSAMRVAERVMSRLFECDTDQANKNVDKELQVCDKSSTEASQKSIHSISNTNLCSASDAHVYDGIANRLVTRGLSSASSTNIHHQQKSKENSNRGNLAMVSSKKAPICRATDSYQFCDMLGNHPSYVHSAITCDFASSQQGTNHSSSRTNSCDNSRGSFTSKSSSRKSKYSYDRKNSSSQKSDDSYTAINSMENFNAYCSGNERNDIAVANSCQLRDDYSDKRRGKPEQSPERVHAKSRLNLPETPHHGSKHHHDHHHHVVGNKKNFDQFAHCLSRDLLTNAFLQVQEYQGPFVYPRRSSEPMQISDGVALQRLENSIHSLNGKRSHKSMTVEDIGPFEVAWANELECINHRNETGFRDPVLSRFAEELMKANVSVPTLHLISDCVSTSGSSRSVCSTISSFRDPLLASFEDELLNTSSNRVSNFSFVKTQMSWSKMKGSICSPRQNESKNNTTKNIKQRVNSISIESEFSMHSWKSAKSNIDAVCCSDTVSQFAESLAHRIVCEALSAIVCMTPTVKYVSLEMYSEMLAADIMRAAVLAVETKCSEWLEQSKGVTWSEETNCQKTSVVKEKGRHSEKPVGYRRSSSYSLETGSSCVEYEDCLDFPYKRLEDFADSIASNVVNNSVAIIKREKTAVLRRQHGRPLSTGNWGCGAFGGDPHLKSLIQWLAASYAGVPTMIYYTFNDSKMEKFEEVIQTVQNRGWDVSQLMQAIRRYCITAESELQLTGTVSKDLFTVILQGEVFPHM